MDLTLEHNDIREYLKPSELLDFDTNEALRATADWLKDGTDSEIELVKKSFEYVRDQIDHSADINGHIVTCKASEVLREKQGICYAKAHLLAALLRYMEIPTGFCYQKLILDDEMAPYLIIHGLNAVYLKEMDKWIRLDARGNKPGVNAQFSIYEEKLAFKVRKDKGEIDIPIIFSCPDRNVVNTLLKYYKVEEPFSNLPTELA